MTYLPSAQTTRRLLKVCSLGLAGLVASLLSGCKTSTINAAGASATLRITTNAEFTSSDIPETSRQASPRSIEDQLIPSLRHPPSARRLRYGSVHSAPQTTGFNSRSRS